MYTLRLMLITRSRQLLSLAAWTMLLLAIVYLHVVDFVLTFCLGGFVPGTDIAISPLTAMYISCLAVVGIGYALLLRVRTASARRRRYHAMRRPVVARQAHVFVARMSANDARETARTRQLTGVTATIRHRLADWYYLGMMLVQQLLENAFGASNHAWSVVRQRLIAPVRHIDTWLDDQFRPVD